MWQIVLKFVITSAVIVTAAELGKRFSFWAAILVSLPLTSILAMIWLYVDTGSVEKVSQFSFDVFWAVLPSLLFFIIFPILLKRGIGFAWAMTLSCLTMVVGYGVYAWVLGYMSEAS